MSDEAIKIDPAFLSQFCGQLSMRKNYFLLSQRQEIPFFWRAPYYCEGVLM